MNNPVKSVWRIPPLYFLLCLGIAVAASVLFPSLNRVTGPTRFAGALFVIAGVIVLVWSLQLFKKHGTPERLDLPTLCLVSEGPYRFSRNPQYLSGVSILVGSALFFGNALSFLAPTVFYLCMRLLVIPYEERAMRELFAKRYLDYTERVRRWI